MRILFVMPAMCRAGAEMQVKEMAIRLVARGHKVGIVVLLPILDLADELRDNGVDLWSLGMRRSVPSASGAARFLALVHRWRPDVIQGWLYAGNLLGGLGSVLTGTPLAWGIRSTDIDPTRRSSQRMMRAGALVSGWLPKVIFVNSSAGREFHASMGYAPDRLSLIPNGFDVARYHPDPKARREVRTELGIAPDAPVVGIVARFDPDKDHATFFRAAALLRRRMSSVRFLVVGRDLYPNPLVEEWMMEGQTGDACIFTGMRGDTPRLNNAMDVATLSSKREGFPNALGEAMACGIPCVATAAGDSAELLGDTGLSVPIGDAGALAENWEALLRLPPGERAALGEKARARIAERFVIDAIVTRYEREWTAMAGAGLPTSRPG